MNQPDLSTLPRVDRVLAHPSLLSLHQQLGAAVVTELTRAAIQSARDAALAGGAVWSIEEVAECVLGMGRHKLARMAQPVINATGVVLHTNLGRAPLPAAAERVLGQTSGRYTSLEMELETGRRGGRGAFMEESLARLSGAEAALVVNNCAAAVLLILGVVLRARLDALGGGDRPLPVVISRGELIEIGGGFRVPDVMERSGAKLLEVGTTNRTRIGDYERALDAHPDVAALLRVHQGNFRQTGFVERPTLRELSDLAHRRQVPLIKDLGGGALLDMAAWGLGREPSVKHCIAEGVDVVCFSTDKILGGPQGGALVGRAEWIARARRDPLARALRLGRLPLVALEQTLLLYERGTLEEIPTVRALSAPYEEVRQRAEEWTRRLQAGGVIAETVDTLAAVGGGALADTPIRSAGTAVTGQPPDILARALRGGDPPVVGRISEQALILDARTVLAAEQEAMIDAVIAAVARARDHA